MLQGEYRGDQRPMEVGVFWVLMWMWGCPSAEPPLPAEIEPRAVAEAPAPKPLPPVQEARLSARQILIAHEGAVDAPPGVTRNESDAQTLAETVHRSAVSGAAFAELVAQHGDGPESARGGHLGVWATGTMLDPVERAVASVEPGRVAPLVRTPFGFHILKREAVVAIAVRHIVVHHRDAHESTSERTVDAARIRAQQARDALEQGQSFDEVARAFSDGPTASTGGDLGWLSPGQFVPSFEGAALRLEPDAISPLVETPYGIHVIQRTQ